MNIQRLVVMVLLALAACGGTPAANAPPSAPTPAGTGSAPLRTITLAMPYIPNVQFAQYYVADKKGYYAAEGLQITFDYNFETDVVQRVAQNTVAFGMASGDSVLLARAQGLPVVMVSTTNQQFPTVFYSKQEAGISEPADLKGRSVGIPGRFGASYIGLLALLYASGIDQSELNIQEIGFAQVAALSEDKVEVASGYGNNEPVQLARQGIDLNIIRVADAFPLASDGIITSEPLIAGDPDLVRGFVRATLRGMRDVIDDPEEAFAISLEYIPELATADQATRELQRAVLDATLPYWQSEQTTAEGLGFSDERKWVATHEFLRASGILTSDVAVTQAFTNQFIK
ncbi:MAG TPA: ABC transporter substrate-binding protein [Roseiflexaceae bacterium]|nr:ABC transporter substrate-binding protein [Roseiflexaceae bacterium]HMP40101.1 ABC transporter substrate-binding protein [Roseiflexaceae bacterium]